jgi:hypothetical protein
MRQATPGSGAPAGSAARPAATETVERPRPGEGMRRGKYEAPPWAFWVVLALVVVGSTLYLLHRTGVLRLRKGPRT